MYNIDVTGAYQWLEFWTGVKHPRFDGITIDNSSEMRRRLDEEGAAIKNDAICNDDVDVAAMNAHVDDDDVNNDIPESPASNTGCDLLHAAVLPKQSLLNGGVNLALQALNYIIHPDDKNAGDRVPPPITVVSRGEDPIVESDENDVLMSAVFASLFLLGKGLSKGSLNKKFLRHFFIYYDGRFEDPCSSLRPYEAKKLNAKVCRIMSMVGSTVPFSPFECEATRPKLAAMRLRYGIGSHFLTGSPPEFEDLSVLRLAIMRDTHQWNNVNCPLQRTGFTRADLPDDFVSNAGARMAVTRPHPALAVMSFANHMRILLDDVVRCPMAAHTRVSRDYLQREPGAYLNIAAISGVIEPQKGGRPPYSRNAKNIVAFASTVVDRVVRAKSVSTPVAITTVAITTVLGPQQPNGYDCGVYALLNIMHLVRHYDNIVAVQGPGLLRRLRAVQPFIGYLPSRRVTEGGLSCLIQLV
ncbi:unnamed protein product [Lampetra planeri]